MYAISSNMHIENWIGVSFSVCPASGYIHDSHHIIRDLPEAEKLIFPTPWESLHAVMGLLRMSGMYEFRIC